MKKLITYMLAFQAIALLFACKKDNYPGHQISPYVSIFDIRDLYRGQDVTLSKDNMFGSDLITGIVTSDHSQGNLPPGLVTMQDRRRLSQLRGIAIALGPDAANYQPGDSRGVGIRIDPRSNPLRKLNGCSIIGGFYAIKELSELHVHCSLRMFSPNCESSSDWKPFRPRLACAHESS